MERIENEGIFLNRDERIVPVLRLRQRENVPYLTFPKLEACEKIDHLFSTRAGGVSEGQFRSMNFSVKLGDLRDNVLENYKRIARVLNCNPEDVVGTVQTHTANIRRVTEEDLGKGIVREPDYGDVDGLVTDVKGVTLAAYTADCVPIYFVDPVKEVIGLAHSGWRGTVSNMAGKMVARLTEEFGTNPKDLIAAIGPSICRRCYEVDGQVQGRFAEMLGDDRAERTLIAHSGAYPMGGKGGGEPGDRLRRVIEPGKAEGKYQLDLWLANLILLVRAGVDPEKVDVTDLCTAENADVLFSHRATQGKRGNMGAFLKLKKF